MTNCTDASSGRPGRTRLMALAALTALVLSACAAPGPARPTAGSSSAGTPSAAAPERTAAAAPDVAAKGDPDQRFQQALALMKARKVEQAQAELLKLSRDYPNFSGPLTDLGILYAQGRQQELAVASLTRAVALNPNNEVAHNWLGTLHRENGEFGKAERAYASAIRVKPAYAQAHLNLAILYDVALHRPQQALDGYREYQRLSGDDSLIVEAWIRDLQARLAPAATPTVVADGSPR